MDFIMMIITFILHLDTHIEMFIQNYGAFTYIILFMIIFLETGLVVTPFLPGDSLIFAAAAFAAKGALDPFILIPLLLLAAIAGDSLNYLIGKKLGAKLSNNRFVKKEYIKATEDFYAKYGGRAIVIARFMPIIRTFAPFVAGIGRMNYARFMTYNITGSFLWICIISTIGFVFGNIPFVKEHFSLVTIAIIVISVIPAFVTFFNEKRKKGVKR